VTTIAERLKEARLEANLSQPALAKRARVSPGTIGNIEAGTRSNPRELLAIAAAVKVRPEWLKTGALPKRDPDASQAESDQSPPLNPRQRILLGLFDGLTAKQQEDMIRELEATKRQNDEVLTELLKRRVA